MLKMALPYGVVRAIQAMHQHQHFLEALGRVQSEQDELKLRIAALEAESDVTRTAKPRHPAEQDRTDTAESARQLAMEREVFVRNEIVLDGKRIHARSEAPLIDLQVDGHGHTIILHSPTGPGTLHVITQPGTVGCRFEFGAHNRIAANVFVSFFHSGGQWAKQSTVSIGEGNLFNGNVHIHAGICPFTTVRVGNENLFADNIQIVGAVEHLTYDVATLTRESVEQGVTINDRVWICKDVLIYNKTEIASNTVVAARSVTNRRFDESHTVIAGAPAKVAKRGVMWHVNTTDDYLGAAGPLALVPGTSPP